jgi:RNA polymerase sigma-70 factor (ECF subfamily)
MNKKPFYDFIETKLDSAYRFAYSYAGNQQDAEDIVAESVEKALRRLSTLKEPAYMKTWFYRIMINTAINNMQRAAKVIPVTDEVLETVVYDSYASMHFQDIIKVLTPHERAILVLRFCEDKLLREIADILETNENTLKTQLYAALKKLQVEMEK